MNKFLAMLILKPDISEKRINNVQNNILNLFEQSTKVRQVWYLGKRKLDFKHKKYSDGIFMKLSVTAKPKKIEQIRQTLRENQDILSSIIINNDCEKENLPVLKTHKLPFSKQISTNNNMSFNQQDKKIFMLISKNIKLPFSESHIVVMSEDESKILQYANKKIQEYVYMKGYRTLKPFKYITDVEKELKKFKKVQFALGYNSNVEQELIIQEKSLI